MNRDEVPPDDVFCPWCGTKLPDKDAEQVGFEILARCVRCKAATRIDCETLNYDHGRSPDPNPEQR